MSGNLNSFYQKVFPVRQILIRQNGDVKHIILASWLQLFLAVLLAGSIVWLSISSFRVYTQTIKIDHIEQSQQEQQTVQSLQVKQLNALEQKQALLESVIDSLPESLNKKIVNGNTSLSYSINEGESQYDDSLEGENTTYQHSDTVTSFDFSDSVDLLTQHYEHNFLSIEKQIDLRQAQILTVLNNVGLTPTLEKYLKTTPRYTGQGGPLEVIDDIEIPSQFLLTADKLVALNSLETFLSELPSALPLPDSSYYISSHFGLRKDPINNRRAYHKGIDLAGSKNTEIYAPADAKVLRAGRNGSYGNFIELQHKSGVVTRFGHLSKIEVKKGQTLAKNDIIGLMGSTGRSTSTHLHYEVLLDGKQVNPLKLTKALSYVR